MKCPNCGRSMKMEKGRPYQKNLCPICEKELEDMREKSNSMQREIERQQEIINNLQKQNEKNKELV